MGKKPIIFLLCIFSLQASMIINRAECAMSDYGDVKRAPIDIIIERYHRDETFRLYSNLSLIILFFVLLLSGLAMYLGIDQLVLWTFIGSWIATELVLLFLSFMKLGFLIGPCGFFVSFAVSLSLALYVQLKRQR